MKRCSRTVLPVILAVALHLAASPFGGRAFSAASPVVKTLTEITEGVSTPVRLAGDRFGNIYSSDPRGGGINRYGSDGRLQKTFAAAKNVLGIAIAQNGDLLASQGSSVAVVDMANGVTKSRFGTFVRANGIAVDSNGFIYVTDSLDNCVQVFDPAYNPVNTGQAATGKPANSFGTTGKANGQFMQPSGISFEKISNQLAVVDTLNGRVQFFSTSGIYQKSLGTFGSGPLKFTSPQGIAFEDTQDDRALNRIYVVDSYQGNVQVIDAASNAFLRYIGGYGLGSGKMVVPADIFYDRFDSLNNRLVISNGSGSLALFGIDRSGTSPGSGPALAINTFPLVTNLTSLTINGSTSKGATVTINGTAAAVSGSSWSATVNLTSGVNVLTVAAADASGSTVETVNVNLLTASNSPTPVALTVEPLPTVTANASITLSGSVTSGSSVNVNGSTATVNGDRWSRNVTLGQGNNSFIVIASQSGRSDSAASFSINLDITPPALTAFLPQSGSSTGRAVHTISGSVADGSPSSVTVSVNGISRSVAVNDGMFSVALVLAGGSNSVTVSAVDAAGNQSSPMSSIISYNPTAPALTLETPNGAVSNSPAYTLSGTAPAGSIVTVNSGAPLSLNGTTWSTGVDLVPGLNSFEIKASEPVSGSSSSIVGTVIYGQSMPAVAITTPAQDLATARTSQIITGIVTAGANVSATVNDISVPVTVSDTAFSLVLPAFTSSGSYTVNVKAADNFGMSSSTTRTLIYDPTVPAISLLSTTPVKVTATGGVLAAKDKNGQVGNATYSGGVASLDLSGVSYDPATLNIYAITAAGTSTRNGDLDLNGKVDIADALLALRTLTDIAPPASFEQMLHGDVGPRANHEPAPDGKIGLDDVVLILRKAVGLDQ